MSLAEYTEFIERRWKAKSVWRWASAGQKWPVNFCRHAKIYRPYSLSVPSVSSSEASERVRDLRRSSGLPRETRGFSLIEVLVSMTVLIVIIVMVTNMFRNASEAWDMGTQRAEMNTSARAAIEYIARELSCAVAGSIPDSAGSIRTLKEFKLTPSAVGNVQDLSFTALSGEDQSLRGIRFKCNLTNHTIEADFVINNFQPYALGGYSWDSSDNLLITNVWRFEITVCSNESQMAAGAIGWNYDSSVNSNSLPACVDISIEMLGEQNMARALTPGWSVAQQEGFVMTNSRVYTTRVCFPNRGGGK